MNGMMDTLIGEPDPAYPTVLMAAVTRILSPAAVGIDCVENRSWDWPSAVTFTQPSEPL